VPSCNPGFGNCDGVAVNGCETNITSNVYNCGACGHVCGVGQLCTNSACVAPPTTATYSQVFTSTQAPAAQQCSDWIGFFAAAQGTPQQTITLKGSLNATGYTCTGSDVASLVAALAGGGNFTASCNGATWVVSNLGAGFGSELAIGAGNSCTATAAIRPCIGNENWGGFNGLTCSPPSQSITVTVQ
jgi:hypothetical protein